MSILLVELNPNKVLIDETLFSDRQKDDFIYEHLRHYCSKFVLLPTIDVRVDAESVFVVRGHMYLAIAKELGCPCIRAIIDKKSSQEAVAIFLQDPLVVQLNWEKAVSEARNSTVDFIWFIFFFKSPLTGREKKIFEKKIVNFFSQIQLPAWAEIPDERIKNMNYPYFGHCAEFQAYIPIEDERWYASSRAVLVDFHLKCVPIVSFQGRKFRLE